MISSEPSAKGPTIIVGINGQFGRLFARRLEGRERVGVDVQPSPSLTIDRYIAGDITTLADEHHDLLRRAAAIVFCTPEDVTLAALPTVLPLASPGAMVVDISSVKSRIAAEVSTSIDDGRFVGGYVSLHPMFAPAAAIADSADGSVSFAGLHMAVCRLADSALSPPAAAVLDALIAGATITELTADDHDRATAWLQVGAHAAILAWALAAARTGLPSATLRQLSTTFSGPLLAMLARIANGEPSLYASIQSHNPHGHAMRRTLSQTLESLNAAVLEDDRAAIEAAFAQTRAFFGDAHADYVAAAADIVARAKAIPPDDDANRPPSRPA